MFGLSKERPTLGDHVKAHISGFHEIRQISHEIRQISVDFMISSGFNVKSNCKPYKSNNSRKTLQFYGVH